MNELNPHFLSTVLEDVEFLKSNWGRSIKDSEIRRNSPVLRHLLVEGNLQKAANMLNLKFQILSPLTSFEGNLPDIEHTTFFMSGGAKLDSGYMEHMQMLDKAYTAEEVKERYDNEQKIKGKTKPVSIDQFLCQTSFIVHGVKISRRTVIKYVANKLGGAHYDEKREAAASISAIEKEYEKYPLLDSIQSMQVMDRNPIYFEMIGIGQKAIQSRDTDKLIRHIKSLQEIVLTRR
jgi:hypothetical protein